MTKFGELKSIGHNIADSLASGLGLPIGVYMTDIFGEAASSTEGHITVDFLNGSIASGSASPNLAGAIALYKGALTELCTKHGANIADFKTLTARFGTDHAQRSRFVVTVEDHEGRQSADAYYGAPGAKLKRPPQR